MNFLFLLIFLTKAKIQFLRSIYVWPKFCICWIYCTSFTKSHIHNYINLYMCTHTFYFSKHYHNNGRFSVWLKISCHSLLGILSNFFLCNQFFPIIIFSTLGFCLQNSFADQNILLLLVAIRFSSLGSYFTYEYSSLSIAGASISQGSQNISRGCLSQTD